MVLMRTQTPGPGCQCSEFCRSPTPAPLLLARGEFGYPSGCFVPFLWSELESFTVLLRSGNVFASSASAVACNVGAPACTLTDHVVGAGSERVGGGGALGTDREGLRDSLGEAGAGAGLRGVTEWAGPRGGSRESELCPAGAGLADRVGARLGRAVASRLLTVRAGLGSGRYHRMTERARLEPGRGFNESCEGSAGRTNWARGRPRAERLRRTLRLQKRFLDWSLLDLRVFARRPPSLRCRPGTFTLALPVALKG
ncbi:uncharacterized protein LOC112398369 isoform X1 [Neophocaena asiaeorientalis asiaeorientalis]|uniref:Uncharacterized protein LOC112398369 isoform X1 n=1 Tax=Neophocaena asiaeorientalis asiaeorientalis TaxID=1706337 RepID=A0A341B739_NEOAA|nr:uncharacterized protein LOC112398369 isoform X1 [Neophocaena asiaeorientalis asiaeorientalis]